MTGSSPSSPDRESPGTPGDTPSPEGRSRGSSSATGALQDDVRALVLGCGFDRVGFAAAAEAPGAEHYRQWLARGFAGEMAYLARRPERRADPRAVLAGTRTVVVVALGYRGDSPFGVALPRSDRAEIAAYAQGADYHGVLETRLRRACERLEKRFPAVYRYYVDTGPVLEKDWAHQAGVGWLGKNTCVIDQQSGSFFFLGVILTTLDVPPDPPATDHCGSCRLCLDACPTNAIVESYVLDARLCISYLTIEHRGAIASELEEKTGNLVFGCDICQEVCPWNDPDHLQGDPELDPRRENQFPDLRELAELTIEGFRRRFRNSAVKRAKYGGLLRNSIVALGNSERPALRETLRRLAASDQVSGDPVLCLTAKRARLRLDASTKSLDSPDSTVR